jgi:hypothetical protein
MQPYFFAYGAGISVFSPYTLLHQLCKLNPQVVMPQLKRVRLAASVFAVQTTLKALQMTASTPIKEYFNPWAAFAAVGVLQGGVYGHASIYFSQQLGLNKTADFRGLFRGAGFAGTRDLVSQGVPFVYSPIVRENVFDRILGVTPDSSPSLRSVSHWSAILSTSVVATYLSQPFMLMQIVMQTSPGLSHAGTLQQAWARNGFSLLYKGAEARVGLLLVVNVLNELLLKPAWAPIPIEDAT